MKRFDEMAADMEKAFMDVDEEVAKENGHYVALCQVRFSITGAWTWEMSQANWVELEE